MNKHLLNRRQFNARCAALGLALPTASAMFAERAVAQVSGAGEAKAGAHTVKLPDGTSVSALGQGCWHLGQGRHPEAVEEEAIRTLASLSVRTVRSVRQRVSSLSGGQRQTVAIARAVLWNSKVVILDEPTAALGVVQTQQVLEIVRRLADKGLAVVLISHNMNDVFAVADRIAALFLGRMVAQVEASQVTHAQVVELITSGRSGGLGLEAGRG